MPARNSAGIRRTCCRSPPLRRPRAPGSTSRDAGTKPRGGGGPPARRACGAGAGWKVLRVLANLLGVTGFDYLSSEDVRNELKGALDGMYAAPPAAGAFVAGHLNGVDKVRGTPIYRVDAVVRRSRPLQE